METPVLKVARVPRSRAYTNLNATLSLLYTAGSPHGKVT